ncbi:leucine-rich repeat domain-containing protein [Clostridium sp. OF10-22XD]|nr:leucine-rich repeat domain-containing protein [Clostridium sp. OF10-22XD]
MNNIGIWERTMRNYRYKLTIALGIGAICGMLCAPVKLVHAEQQTTENITGTEAGPEPAAGYMEIEDSGSEPELFSNYDIAVQSTDNTTQSGTWENVSWSLSGKTLTISGSGDMPNADSSKKAPWITFDVEKVVIKNGITSIGSQNFVQMTTITSVSYPNTLTTIGEAAFYRCYGLTEIVLPSSVKTVGTGAYCDCSDVTTIVTPGVTGLGYYAFEGTSVSTYEIPAGLTSISPLVFFANETIRSYTVAAGNPSYIAQDGVVYTKDKTELVMYPFRSSVGTFTIPASVKTIGTYAFYNVNGLDSVDFANVTTLGEGAFYCSKLSGTLTISDKITEVGFLHFRSATISQP